MNVDKSYALLCQSSYQGTPDFGTVDGPRVFKATIEGRLTFCFPGSRSIEDWLLDAVAIPALDTETFDDAKLGPLHYGFLVRANKCLDLIQGNLLAATEFSLCGHSLGGAIALLAGAMLVAEGHKAPAEIVTFGAPRAGFEQYAEAVSSIPIRQYRFGADPVPLVPTHPFVHAKEPLFQIGTPVGGLNLFANHSITNYIGALGD
jgi:predicted lipase